jgi:hypothetical protein
MDTVSNPMHDNRAWSGLNRMLNRSFHAQTILRGIMYYGHSDEEILSNLINQPLAVHLFLNIIHYKQLQYK